MTTTAPRIKRKLDRPRSKPRTSTSTARTLPRSTLLFALPAAVLYAFVLVVPSIQGGSFAFTNWTGLGNDFDWVGIANFVTVLTSASSLHAIFVTLLIALVVMVFQNIFGVLLALGVNSKIKSRNVLRTFLFAPAVMTPVVTGYLWQFILTPDGPLNGLLGSMGLGFLAQNWLGDPHWALFSIILMVIWQFSGYSMVIYLAGLQGIPQDLLEAASVDGAGAFRKFWSVVRPLLAPAITISVMLSVIMNLKLFDQIWVLTGGGPGGETNNLSTLIYNNAFKYGEFGTSMAMAVVLTVLVAVISGVQYRSLLKQEGKN